MLWVMASLQAYKGKPVNIRRLRDCSAFQGVLEEVSADGVLIRLADGSGVTLEEGDKCVFLMPNLIFLAIFESKHMQSFLSRLDQIQDRLDFSLLATFPNKAAEEAQPAA